MSGGILLAGLGKMFNVASYESSSAEPVHEMTFPDDDFTNTVFYLLTMSGVVSAGAGTDLELTINNNNTGSSYPFNGMYIVGGSQTLFSGASAYCPVIPTGILTGGSSFTCMIKIMYDGSIFHVYTEACIDLGIPVRSSCMKTESDLNSLYMKLPVSRNWEAGAKIDVYRLSR